MNDDDLDQKDSLLEEEEIMPKIPVDSEELESDDEETVKGGEEDAEEDDYM